MSGFSADGERVGETEYARMQTKELLKQQVRIVSEVVMESGHAAQTSELHKFAKQILRVLASCNLMSLAE
jgi:3,4-dihydroxy-2-butanone 4-phosphate synthase